MVIVMENVPQLSVQYDTTINWNTNPFLVLCDQEKRPPPAGNGQENSGRRLIGLRLAVPTLPGVDDDFLARYPSFPSPRPAILERANPHFAPTARTLRRRCGTQGDEYE